MALLMKALHALRIRESHKIHSRHLMGSARRYIHSPSIWVSDPSTLVDEKIGIKIKGLMPQQKVTVVAGLKEGRAELVSHAHFEADNSGDVDLQTTASLGGTYCGLDSMGLFWSMVLAKHVSVGTRLVKKDVTQPYKIRLSVLNGHQKVDTLIEENEQSLLKDLEIERWYMKDVDRIPIQEGRIRGTLFTPTDPDKQSYPGVIDLFGTAGGLMEFRASLLASRGFTVLALAYFAYEDLPKGIAFDYDYFDEALQWFIAHPRINKSGIGVIGVSKGAEIALHMACYNEQVKIMAALGGLPFYSFGVHTYRGKKINTHMGSIRVWDCVLELRRQSSGRLQPSDVASLPAGHDLELVEFTDEGLKIEKCTESSDGADYIPFEKSGHCELLLIQGDDDTNTGANQTDKMAAILDQHGLSNYKVMNYPGTGHLIEPPYTPLCRITYHKLLGSNMLYGGNPVDHAKAQEHCWHTIVSRMRQKLGDPSHSIDTSKL